MLKPGPKLLVAVVAGVFLLAACGSDDETSGGTGAADQTTTAAQDGDPDESAAGSDADADADAGSDADADADGDSDADADSDADGADAAVDPTELVSTAPPGAPMTPEEVATLKALFDDEAYIGGQSAPRLVKWITPDSYLFVQFDSFDPAEGSTPLFLGLGVKGVFCSEAQPDAEGGSFTHFHQPSVGDYSDGHGGPPGEQGYWLSFVALAEFDAQGRAVVPGIDYELSPTPPPDCGDDVPSADFDAPGQQALSSEDLGEIVAFFDDPILEGGQTAPRLYKSVNEDVAMFIQLDAFDPAEATTIRYVGISQRGVFCDQTRPSPDFTHYHRHEAAEYSDGHGGPPGESEGYWLAFVATHPFELLFPGQDESEARDIAPGVDRQFASMEAPSC